LGIVVTNCTTTGYGGRYCTAGDSSERRGAFRVDLGEPGDATETLLSSADGDPLRTTGRATWRAGTRASDSWGRALTMKFEIRQGEGVTHPSNHGLATAVRRRGLPWIVSWAYARNMATL